MKNKQLTIIVAGEAGHGKSSMLYQLEKLLKENGYNVELDGNNLLDFTSINDFHRKMKRNEEERLVELKENTQITLKEIQTARGSSKKENQTEVNIHD